VQDLVDGLDLLIRRRMKNNNNSADQAYSTAELAQRTKLFVEEVRAKNSANEHTESSKRCDEDSRGESVCGKVADFS